MEADRADVTYSVTTPIDKEINQFLVGNILGTNRDP